MLGRFRKEDVFSPYFEVEVGWRPTQTWTFERMFKIQLSTEAEVKTRWKRGGAGSSCVGLHDCLCRMHACASRGFWSKGRPSCDPKSRVTLTQRNTWVWLAVAKGFWDGGQFQASLHVLLTRSDLWAPPSLVTSQDRRIGKKVFGKTWQLTVWCVHHFYVCWRAV